MGVPCFWRTMIAKVSSILSMTTPLIVSPLASEMLGSFVLFEPVVDFLAIHIGYHRFLHIMNPANGTANTTTVIADIVAVTSISA